MLCEGCGFTFCPEPQAPTVPPQRYCSAECRKRVKYRKGKRIKRRGWADARGITYFELLRSCAKKKRYPTVEAALTDWAAYGNTTGGAYPCDLVKGAHFHTTRRDDAPYPVSRSEPPLSVAK